MEGQLKIFKQWLISLDIIKKFCHFRLLKGNSLWSKGVMDICHHLCYHLFHYTDVIMGTLASQITSLTIVYSTVYSDADQRKYQTSASPAFVRGIHRPNSPHKWPVTRKMFPFDDVIMLGNGLVPPARNCTTADMSSVRHTCWWNFVHNRNIFVQGYAF